MMDLVELVERVSPSVVGVVTKLEDLWGLQAGTGFGTAFSAGGNLYITAHHVIAAGGDVRLVTPDGFTAPARVIAEEPEEDVAILYSELKVPAIKLGSALALKAGEPVIALGYPLGLLDKPTVTSGIVSAVGRTLRLPNRVFEFLIQTDASINPGNSGGPLVNMRGEAVGVNSAIIQGAQGIGFAVAIDVAKVMMEMLQRYGRYVRPRLGVYVVTINRAMAALHGLPTDRGLYVAEVVPGSLADRLGVERGDIIVAVDDAPVSNVFELRTRVAQSLIRGAVPTLEVYRGDRRLVLG